MRRTRRDTKSNSGGVRLGQLRNRSPLSNISHFTSSLCHCLGKPGNQLCKSGNSVKAQGTKEPKIQVNPYRPLIHWSFGYWEICLKVRQATVGIAKVGQRDAQAVHQREVQAASPSVVVSPLAVIEIPPCLQTAAPLSRQQDRHFVRGVDRVTTAFDAQTSSIGLISRCAQGKVHMTTDIAH